MTARIAASIAALIIALMCATAHVTLADEWTKTDTAFQLTWTAMSILDWSQARQAAKEPWKFRERNPILGDHPSIKALDTYSVVSIAGNWAIARALPNPYRRYFQFVSIGASGYCIMVNFSGGIGGGDWF